MMLRDSDRCYFCASYACTRCCVTFLAERIWALCKACIWYPLQPFQGHHATLLPTNGICVVEALRLQGIVSILKYTELKTRNKIKYTHLVRIGRISSFWSFFKVFVADFCTKLSLTSRFILKQLGLNYSLSISVFTIECAKELSAISITQLVDQSKSCILIGYATRGLLVIVIE